jgi:4a-hydroxytetrahydrobiopterin dehydratase
MTELAGKTCTPCRGGVPPMEQTEAEHYLREASGWS